MARAKVELRADGQGKGTLSINGVELSSVVQEVRIISRAGQPTRALIIVDASQVTAEVEAELQVFIVREPDISAMPRGGYAGAEQE